MGAVIEKKLRKLKEKQNSLSEVIKEIEQKNAYELRKIKEKKNRLIGQAINACLEKEGMVMLEKQDDLFILLDKYLRRKTDRELFGLNPLMVNKQSTSIEENNHQIYETIQE